MMDSIQERRRWQEAFLTLSIVAMVWLENQFDGLTDAAMAVIMTIAAWGALEPSWRAGQLYAQFVPFVLLGASLIGLSGFMLGELGRHDALFFGWLGLMGGTLLTVHRWRRRKGGGAVA